jgi:putative addiction module CopG family antidote
MEVRLPSQLAAFVKKMVDSGRYDDTAEVVRESVRRFQRQTELASLGDLGGADIEALAFLVLMQAAKSAQEDLKAIMARVKAINEAKSALRDLMSSVSKDVAANAGQKNGEPPLDFSEGVGSEKAYHRALLPVAEPTSDGTIPTVLAELHKGRITQVDQLRAIRESLAGKPDSLTDLGEFEQLRLQMAMDRRSKAMSVLSNVLKKMSEAQAAIVANLK